MDIVIIVEGQGVCYNVSSCFFSCLVTTYQLITLSESYVYDTSYTCIKTTIHMILCVISVLADKITHNFET